MPPATTPTIGSPAVISRRTFLGRGCRASWWPAPAEARESGASRSGTVPPGGGATGGTVLRAVLQRRRPGGRHAPAAAVRARRRRRRHDRRAAPISSTLPDPRRRRRGRGARPCQRPRHAAGPAPRLLAGRADASPRRASTPPSVTVDGYDRYRRRSSILDPAKVADPEARRQDGAGRHADHRRRPGRQPDLHPRSPACPLHDVTLTDGAAGRQAGRATSSARRRTARPACAGRCSTCCSTSPTPSPASTMVHAEVYVDRARAQQRHHRPPGRRPAARRHRAVHAYNLPFEPVLYLAERRRHDRQPARQHLRHQRAEGRRSTARWPRPAEP